MPVEFNEYERNAAEADWRPTAGSNAAKILTFLLRHAGTGFTPSEIAEETGIPAGSVGPTLQRLRERELVRHREPYWAAAEDDRIASYEGMLRGMEALDGDDGWSDVDAADYTIDDKELETWRDGSENETSGGEE